MPPPAIQRHHQPGTRGGNAFGAENSCRSLAAGLLGLIAFVAVSAFFAYQFTGPQRRPVGAIPSSLPADTRDVTFPARDQLALRGWFVPCPGAQTAVVLLHGHGSTRQQMVARARLLHDHGYAVLLYDARGHGRSAGTLVSAGWYETHDLLGALDFLRAQGFHSFGCLGASQGGATIALAAGQLADVHWVVLESPTPPSATPSITAFGASSISPSRSPAPSSCPSPNTASA